MRYGTRAYRMDRSLEVRRSQVGLRQECVFRRADLRA